MQIKRIFSEGSFKNTKIAISKFEQINSFEDRKNVQKTLNKIFESQDVIKSVSVEKYGDSRTTVQLQPDYDLPTLLNFKNNALGKWLYQSISEAGRQIHKNFFNYNPLQPKDYDHFIFVRNWTNRMYKGSHATAHEHKSQCDMVCIFYWEAPPNCADLIFINDKAARDSNEPFFKYSKDICYSIKPEPGLLVCHDRTLPHAVSANDVDDPRTVLILEPFFKSKPIEWLTGK